MNKTCQIFLMGSVLVMALLVIGWMVTTEVSRMSHERQRAVYDITDAQGVTHRNLRRAWNEGFVDGTGRKYYFKGNVTMVEVTP